jgi:lipopolysaccharide/colanic/teichoic acid biosynthesis glycosyltransferase
LPKITSEIRNAVLKRLTDILVSLCGLILLAPLFLLVGLLIKIDSRGSIIFKQIRIGFCGAPFKIYKFRTMRIHQESNRQITIGDDPRITRVGYVLRKSKLDEIPQLVNVLVGNMSLVGPRPEVPRYVHYYTDEERQVLYLKPGITDLASIKYRNESEVLASANDPESTYINQIMRDKLKINLEYAQNASFVIDFHIILLTFRALLKGAKRKNEI